MICYYVNVTKSKENVKNMQSNHSAIYYTRFYFPSIYKLSDHKTDNAVIMFPPDHIFKVRRLYKLIFRVHRGLPPELRVLGDNYARDEFKRHKKCNPEEARIFLNEWTDYAINLAKQMKPLQQAKKKEVGKYLDPKLLDYMTEDQLIQLYELHKAASQEPERPISNSDNAKS